MLYVICIMAGSALGVIMMALLTVNRLNEEYQRGYNDALRDIDQDTH